MGLMCSVGLIAVLAAVALAGADAQSLKLRQRMESEEKGLVSDVESTNKACDAAIAVKFDWKDALQDKLVSFSPESYC